MASSRARLLDVAKVCLQSRAERVLLPPPTRIPEAEPLLPKRKLQLEENNAYVINYISVIQLSYLLCTVSGRFGPSHEVSLVFSFA